MRDDYYDEPEDYIEPEAETCKVCGADMEFTDCWQCGGEGYGDDFHDCGEDCCCCLDPEPGECPECNGAGGWLECPNAEHHLVKTGAK